MPGVVLGVVCYPELNRILYGSRHLELKAEEGDVTKVDLVHFRVQLYAWWIPRVGQGTPPMF